MSKVSDNPERRVLLAGTARTVRQLHRMLVACEQPVEVVGACLIQPANGNGAIGLPLLGTVEELPLILKLHRVERVLTAIPAAMDAATRRVAAVCAEHGVVCRPIATLDDQIAGRTRPFAAAGAAPETDPTSLLDRPTRPLDHAAIRRLLKGRRVLVTGAGGSIGSQLATMIAGYGPAELQLMERAENNLFEITRRLRQRHPDLPVRAMMHDVTHEGRTLALCRQGRPEIIFHAAAHKHVPMLEDHPREAVENNFFGTKAIADAADAVGAERFVMISTDKAVNPSSVMGATKRLAELYIQYLDGRSATTFTMVRFGNVLGSASSVLPIWADQIAEGGPVTVTDARMVRYFMTIPEAAALVVQAACCGESGGQVMLLDMGEPIAVVELARRFIRSQGLEPDRDVPIRFTGVRPGEKLFEELAYDSEQAVPTEHPGVRLWKTVPPHPARITALVGRFERLRQSSDRAELLAALREAVPEMQPAAMWDNPESDDRGRNGAGTAVGETKCIDRSA
jgi:FlaA1/EpsC-like NDP-sugar epimerase